MSEPKKKWYGRIGYDREGICREREFRTEAEAQAYDQGASDMKDLCDEDDDSPLVDYWATHSDQESVEEG